MTSLAAAAVASRAASPADSVAVVANADDPASLALARHYLKARGIPESHLIALPLPADEEIDWTTFVARVRNPLLADLVKRGLLIGELTPQPDAEGRTTLALRGKNFEHLVLCKGVPLKIAHEVSRFNAREKALNLPAHLAVNCASVDAELTLLPRPGTPLAGFVPNPRYNTPKPRPEDTLDTLMVARLDGPTYADATRLVDSAIEAERTGLMGRAYVDMGGPHKLGDTWLNATAELCRNAALDTETEETPELFAPGARFDSPILYFGWYSHAPAGILADRRFRFPAGAVAIHIHSFSATTLRSADIGWAGPLIARGATFTVGNVYEPYLELTHNPAILMRGLATGLTAGEAAACAIPVLGWQSVAIGDPLYRPFAHDLDKQLIDLANPDRAADPAHAYAVLRLARILDSRGESAKADAVLEQCATRLPVLAFARGRLDRDLAAGRRPKFKAASLAPLPEDPGLVTSTAQKLADAGLSAEALDLISRQHAAGVALDSRAADLARRFGRDALARELTPRAP